MAKLGRIAFLAALCAATGACSTGATGLAPISANAAAPQDYRLAAGDKIRLFTYGLDAFNNEYVVGDSGTLSLPFIQTVQVSGKTLTDVQHEIEARLAEQQILRNPVVSIQHVALRPFYILGEVRNPGEYAFRPGTTVMSAVAMAGGFTYRASTGKVAITRIVNGQPVTQMNDLIAYLEDNTRPGDTVTLSVWRNGRQMDVPLTLGERPHQIDPQQEG